MANADKNLIITPARGSDELDPYITFVGANTTTNAIINMFMYPESNGTISFEGSAGQLFSITNDLSGILYSINDADAVSQFNVSANGLNVLSANGGNTTVGTTTKTANLIVYGTLTASNISLPNTVAALNVTSLTATTLNATTANITSFSANTASLNDVVISGNLTVSGTTTTINTQNLLANDSVIVLNSGQSTALNDTGWILQRYATPTISNYNVGFTWDENTDRLVVGRTQNQGNTSSVAYSNEWMTILGTNGNIGIGTTTPAANLHVVGTSIITGNTNIAGNVSIARPNATQLPYALDVNGPVLYRSTNNPTNNYQSWEYNISDYFTPGGSTCSIRSASGKYYGATYSGSAYLQIGYYGHVFSAGDTGNGSTSALKFNPITFTPNLPNYFSKLADFSANVASAANTSVAGYYVTLADYSANTLKNNLYGVYTDVSGGNNATSLRVAGAFLGGSVGISTATPTANLQVVGNTSISANLTVGGFVFASGSGLGIGTTSPTNAFDLSGTNRVASFFYNGTNNLGRMLFQSYSNSGIFEPRIIMYDGVSGNPKITIGTNATSFFTQTNVAIGRETANSALHVLGNIEVSNVDSYTATSASAPISRPTIMFDFARGKTIDPRITFIRGSSASYYDGRTYVRGDENLATYSKFEGGSVWGAINSATFTSNNAIAPDGTTTAGTLTATVQFGGIQLNSATPRFVNGVEYTISVWARRASGTNPIFFFTNNGFQLGNTFSPTSTWARYTTTFTYTGTSNGWLQIQDRATSGFTPVELWGLQVERRGFATEFIPTIAVTVSRNIPRLLTVGSNIPRIDHDPATGVCLGLLTEKAATNYWKDSANLANTSNWITTGISSYANTVIAPDGTLSATVFTEDTATSGHYFLPSATNRNTNSLANQVVTSSIYLKAGTRRYVNFSTENSGVGFNVVFDTQTGTITNTANTAGGIYYSSSVQDVGGGWYRVSATGNVTSGSNLLIIVGGNTTATGPRSESYTGANNTIIAWGAQIEPGFYPTSFIYTPTSATATRSGEYGIVTAANTIPYYNHDEGTFFVEFAKRSTQEFNFIAGIGYDTNNYLGVGYQNANMVYFQPSFGNIPAGGGNNGANNIFMKLALAYTATANMTVTTSSDTTVYTRGRVAGPMDGPTLTPSVYIGTAAFQVPSTASAYIKKIAYYPERFSNEELRQITAY